MSVYKFNCLRQLTGGWGREVQDRYVPVILVTKYIYFSNLGSEIEYCDFTIIYYSLCFSMIQPSAKQYSRQDLGTWW